MQNLTPNNFPQQGILLIDKPKDKTSFYLVHLLRKITKIKKIGHAGTLDPKATGLMVLLIGSNYTKKSDLFLNHDKEYETVIELGKQTSTFDEEGEILNTSDYKPTSDEIKKSLEHFQGTIQQLPPMFSAKKVQGKKLYELAREGKEVQRDKVSVQVTTSLLDYNYPFVKLHIRCSKGTYIRSIANDLGLLLTSFGYVKELKRTRSGSFLLDDSITIEKLLSPNFEYQQFLKVN